MEHALLAENQIISLPRNGEYANETYFFTMDNWKENIRFNFKKEPYDTCLIISDGDKDTNDEVMFTISNSEAKNIIGICVIIIGSCFQLDR